MRVLIKLGGGVIGSPEQRARLACEIRELLADGMRIVVVHGGGKQMTRFLAEQGVESRFIDGMRVTTAEVLDAVLKVFAGSVNHELVAAFIAQGVRAAGLSGMDGLLGEAEPLDPELGFVGKVIRSDPGLIELLTGNGYLPVVACVAGDRRGNYYNVNADQMAAALAASFRADRLLFLTDVEGVRGAEGQIHGSLSVRDCQELMAGQIATGGMRVKLNAAIGALGGGVGRVAILPGATPGALRGLLAGEAVGTAIQP